MAFFLEIMSFKALRYDIAGSYGSFVESPDKKNIPATALIQLEFLFIDGIQH